MIVLLLLAVVVVGLFRMGCDGTYNVLYPIRYTSQVERYAAENGLDQYLVYGVIKAESNFIHDAHSGVAVGLMQITEDTGAWIANKMQLKNYQAADLTDPAKNIKMGCFYLKYLIDYYDDLDLALAAYNAGMGNVNKWLADGAHSKDGKTLHNIPFKETREYVERVKKYTEIYRERY